MLQFLESKLGKYFFIIYIEQIAYQRFWRIINIYFYIDFGDKLFAGLFYSIIRFLRETRDMEQIFCERGKTIDNSRFNIDYKYVLGSISKYLIVDILDSFGCQTGYRQNA